LARLVDPYLGGIAARELGPDLRAKGGASDLVQQTFLEAQRDFAAFRGGSAEHDAGAAGVPPPPGAGPSG
jgi:hypothetical protein